MPDEELNIEKQILFGCTVRSISADLSLSANESIVTVVVVQEEDQQFTFQEGITPNNGINQLNIIKIGDFQFVGLVEEWDEVVTNINGSGIFKVQLISGRGILQNVAVSLRSFPDLQEPMLRLAPTRLATANVISIGLGSTAPLEEDYAEGLAPRLNAVLLAIIDAEIKFGDNSFRIDLSELEVFIGARSDNIDVFRLSGLEKNITELIDTIANEFDFDWFLEILHDETTEENIIKVRIIDFSIDGAPAGFSINDLIALHPNGVISHNQGFNTNRHAVSNLIFEGGIRRVLKEVSGSGTIRPFWGSTLRSGGLFKNIEIDPEIPAGVLSSPGFWMPNTPGGQIFKTTEDEMRLALAGELEDTMDQFELDQIKSYARKFWGKQFYFEFDPNDLDDNGRSWVQEMPDAWWESDIPPNGVDIETNKEFLDHFTRDDGKWTNFIKLPDLNSLENNDTIAPQWDSVMSSVRSTIFDGSDLYMWVTIERRDLIDANSQILSSIWLMTLYDAMVVKNANDEIDRISNMDTAIVWYGVLDPRVTYGTWHTDFESGTGMTKLKPGSKLVPWLNGFPGITHTEGMAALNLRAESRLARFKPSISKVATGQLEVVGLPKINLGTRLKEGGFIMSISMSFTIAGIKTRYVIGMPAIRKDEDPDDIAASNLKDIEANNIVPPIIPPPNPFQEPPQPPPITPPSDDEIPKGLEALAEESAEIIIDKPEGGKGRIVSRGLEGPFYNITRLNARELKEGFGAAMDLAFVAEWTGVRNLGERDNSPGLLPIGQIVNVSIYTDDIGGAEAFIEVTPPNFAPPLPD